MRVKYFICSNQGHVFRAHADDVLQPCPKCDSPMQGVSAVDGRRYVLEKSLSGEQAIIARAAALDPERTVSDLVYEGKHAQATALRIELGAVPQLPRVAPAREVA
jgi:hypothetical protein